MKLLFVVFLIVCVLARVFRSRLAPLIARYLPKRLPPNVARGLGKLENYATHEIAAILEVRLKEDEDALAEQLKNADKIAKLRAALAPTATPPAADPKV